MTTPIASLSIAARATLNMHSLNNEGGEGNQIQTRMVEIVDHAGDRSNQKIPKSRVRRQRDLQHVYRQKSQKRGSVGSIPFTPASLFVNMSRIKRPFNLLSQHPIMLQCCQSFLNCLRASTTLANVVVLCRSWNLRVWRSNCMVRSS